MRLFLQNRLFRVSLVLGLLVLPLLAVSALMIRNLVSRHQVLTVFQQGQQQLAPRIEQILRDVRETEEARNLLFTIRPPRHSPVSFVTSLEAAAAQAGVTQTIAALRADQDAATGPTSVSPVVRYRVKFDCTLDTCEAYLHGLATLPHLASVERAEFTSPPGGEVTQGMSAVLTLVLAVTSSP